MHGKLRKNCIIIHGCPGKNEKAMNPETRTYDKHWMPWLKRKLEENNIPVVAPLMPEPWDPVYEKYKKELEKYDVDEKSVLIGHSCGAAFLVRWLGDTKKKIYMFVLVAPWKIPRNENEIRQRFYNYEIDKTIKDRVGRIVMFTANDEEDEGKESLKIFHGALGGQVVELEGMSHYTYRDMGTEEFPELLKLILEK